MAEPTLENILQRVELLEKRTANTQPRQTAAIQATAAEHALEPDSKTPIMRDDIVWDSTCQDSSFSDLKWFADIALSENASRLDGVRGGSARIEGMGTVNFETLHPRDPSQLFNWIHEGISLDSVLLDVKRLGGEESGAATAGSVSQASSQRPHHTRGKRGKPRGPRRCSWCGEKHRTKEGGHCWMAFPEIVPTT